MIILILVVVSPSLVLLDDTKSTSALAHVTPNTAEFGISINGLEALSADQVNTRFQDIAQLGFSQVRIDFPWNSIQPNNSKSYNWVDYDKIVQAAKKNNLRVLGIIAYTPAWARRPECKLDNYCAPISNDAFAAYAGAVAARYKSTVTDWEIWNEENANNFWLPAANALQYAKLLKIAYPAIKLQSPNAVVLIGGLVIGGGSKDTHSIDPVLFLQHLYDEGAKGSFDGVAYHPYTFPNNFTEHTAAWDKMAGPHSLLSLLRANGDGDKKIWITEFGAPTNGPTHGNYVTEAAQAKLVKQAYLIMQNKPWAGPLFWYGYKDPSDSTNTVDNFYGLRHADGTPKLSYIKWKKLLTQ